MKNLSCIGLNVPYSCIRTHFHTWIFFFFDQLGKGIQTCQISFNSMGGIGERYLWEIHICKHRTKLNTNLYEFDSKRWLIAWEFSGNFTPQFCGVCSWWCIQSQHVNEVVSRWTCTSFYCDSMSVGCNFFPQDIIHAIYECSTSNGISSRSGQRGQQSH